MNSALLIRRFGGCREACRASLILLLAAALPATAADLEQALQLLHAGDAEQAYLLLAPDEAEHSGDPDFDYLLGLAALDSGRPGRAVFALERVLAIDPTHARARAEIARAYFQLGELETARNEFEAVKQQGVPPQVAEAMQRFLSAIDERVDGGRRRLSAYIEAGLGYDSNINSATNQRDVAIPAFGGLLFTLNDDGVEDSDGFGSIGAGFAGSYPLAEQFDLIGGANLAKREHFSNESFETSSVDAHAGIGYTRGLDAYTLALQGETFLLDNSTFRNAYGVVGGWNRELAARTRMSAFMQIFGLDYPGQDIRDAMRYVGGAGISHALDLPYTPVVFASGYAGLEDERRSGVPHLGHDLFGFRLGGEVRLRPQVSAFAGFNVEFRDYGGPEPAFLRVRDDNRYHFRFGFNYRPAPTWLATTDVTYVNNDSNIVVHDHDRVLFAITLRKEFH
ncbi:MAG: tetratricopeptide repeat protein [Gammaproteobacteria bacterium]